MSDSWKPSSNIHAGSTLHSLIHLTEIGLEALMTSLCVVPTVADASPESWVAPLEPFAAKQNNGAVPKHSILTVVIFPA